MKYAMIPVILLVGCGGVAGLGNAPRASSTDACNASAHQALVGQDAAASLALPEPKREFQIGDPVTSDFVAERINIQLDDNDTIAAITCG